MYYIQCYLVFSDKELRACLQPVISHSNIVGIPEYFPNLICSSRRHFESIALKCIVGQMSPRGILGWLLYIFVDGNCINFGELFGEKSLTFEIGSYIFLPR